MKRVDTQIVGLQYIKCYADFNLLSISFHQIESIQLMMDSETGRSKGYGFITVSITLNPVNLIFSSIMNLNPLVYMHTGFSVSR